MCSVDFLSLSYLKFFDRDRWCFVTERYLGKQNKLVKETRIVDLKPL